MGIGIKENKKWKWRWYVSIIRNELSFKSYKSSLKLFRLKAIRKALKQVLITVFSLNKFGLKH